MLIALTWPLMAVAWLCIKMESRGPALHTQLDDGSPVFRVGRDSMPFRYYKFRSMRCGTHSLRYTQLADQNTRSGPLVKIDNDPRVTRVGRFIRKWHIDELPEFFMVLRGDMSIVGPRPHLPEEVEKYSVHHRRVLCVKPGITGLTQIMGGSKLRFCKEIAYDQEYIQQWSLLRDFLIVVRTPFAIVSQRGDN
jgi:lipopolysaccharide/colanic/teichoic acid biosynthesis glycosyltransferase